MASRDNFSQATKNEVALRAGYCCSHPDCGRLTGGPSEDRASGVTQIGVAAHIAAAASGGERYDRTMTRAERGSASNGIWMCANHAKWIDDNASVATIAKLHEWKAAHEAEIAVMVEHGYPGMLGSWRRLKVLSRDHRDTISTALPNGHVVVRDGGRLVEAVEEPGMCMVSGDSGAGKSALVKTVLDAAFPGVGQIWLGPEVLRGALNEVERECLGLTAPLGALLASRSGEINILVVDAVERAGAGAVARLAQLIEQLATTRSATGGWRVVAIGQSAGFEVLLDPLTRALGGRIVPVELLDPVQVRAALASEPALAQHAFDDPFVALLGNLRALGWIVGAGSLFADAGRMAGRTQIADRLWTYWVNGDPDLHSFMIRLARRDAEYERSFGLSDLSQEDRAAWKAGRAQVPLKLNELNRLGFEHDLASDWARYQYLKEISGDVRRWSVLAEQPLWVAALRLFAQFLLRQPDGAGGGWDAAFAAAQAAAAAATADVLLDGLCLDPLADRFLSERADLLFADKGRLLDRLLRRFLHIATVPDLSLLGLQMGDGGLYAEAEMRTPVWRNWPPMIRFIGAHRDAIGALGSRVVSKVCGNWLTKAPERVNGGTVIGRADLTRVAVETARVHQIACIAYAFHGGSSDEDAAMFTAALAGAADQPELVNEFALEMARRRPLSAAAQERVDELKRAERERREIVSDREAKFDDADIPVDFRPRRLPPWPLGPSGRLNGGFRKAVMKSNALTPIMRRSPSVASEVLLACMVEDNPVEDFGHLRLDDRFGLDHEYDGRPTIYWTSPFFPFLEAAPAEAIDALLRLVDFCTGRWAAETEADDWPQPFRLMFADGIRREFVGGVRVLDWGHSRLTSGSQLGAALDALERRLWTRMNSEEDIGPTCADLLQRSGSAAILGVLADCAKWQPDLLKGALTPLLTSPELLWADERRLTQRCGNDFFTWYRAGEAARKIGMEWEAAPHRAAPLTHVIRVLRREAEFDGQAVIVFDGWEDAGPDLTISQRALLAELDPVNWRDEPDGKGGLVATLHYPPDLVAEIAALRPTERAGSNLAGALSQLQSQLGAEIDDETAADLQGALADDRRLELFDHVDRRIIRTALAALLLVGGRDWIDRNPGAVEGIAEALDRSVPRIGEEPDSYDGRLDFGPGLPWACLGAVHALASEIGTAEKWGRMLSYGLATGNPGVIRTIMGAARLRRDGLGPIYQAILNSGILAAALESLQAGYEGGPGWTAPIAHWRRRLAALSLLRPAAAAKIDLVALAAGVERLWRSRFLRVSTDPRLRIRSRDRRRFSHGLNGFILAGLFDWALVEDATPTLAQIGEHRDALRALWAYQDWLVRREPVDDPDGSDTFDRLDDFGLTILRTIAARIPLGSAAEGRSLWEPVLGLGPMGEFTVEHLIDCMFLRLYKGVDASNFNENWSAMVAFVFAPGWEKGGRRWRGRSIMRHVLGIDASNQIENNADVMAHVASLGPYFEKFAADRVAHDNDTLAHLARFLASAAGRDLRLSAIGWIETALGEDDSRLRDSAPSALAELVRVLLEEHGAELIEHSAARQSLINVIGRMVREQMPYALVLQDRAKVLR